MLCQANPRANQGFLRSGRAWCHHLMTFLPFQKVGPRGPLVPKGHPGKPGKDGIDVSLGGMMGDFCGVLTLVPAP